MVGNESASSELSRVEIRVGQFMTAVRLCDRSNLWRRAGQGIIAQRRRPYIGDCVMSALVVLKPFFLAVILISQHVKYSAQRYLTLIHYGLKYFAADARALIVLQE